MRILLDEDLPRRLAAMLVGHEVSIVQRSGWTGIKNGKLLGLAASEFDVFLTMDGNLEFARKVNPHAAFHRFCSQKRRLKKLGEPGQQALNL
ncbi:MAG: DUF5615 family PIN-like protein [Betaproteobacteria bacterium]|nr:DUF5615 family PIN-like protein [Betaproteobacteria bacterium]